MQYGSFVKDVAGRIGGDRARAEAAIEATLVTLAERLTPGEAQDLIAQLPVELKLTLRPPLAPTPRSADEFVATVAEREGVDDTGAARRDARAVLQTLQLAVSAGEMNEVLAQLPEDYADLIT